MLRAWNNVRVIDTIQTGFPRDPSMTIRDLVLWLPGSKGRETERRVASLAIVIAVRFTTLHNTGKL